TFHAETEQRHPFVDLVDTNHVADRVEVDVARLLNRLAHFGGAVPPFAPAFERPAIKVRAARAMDPEVWRDNALLERRKRNRHLECRNWRVAPLNPTVVER